MNFKVDKCKGYPNIKRVWVPIEELLEGVEFVKENKIEGILLYSPNDFTPQTIDFNFLIEVPFVKSIDLSVKLHENSKIEGLYSLKQLINLTYFEYDNFPLDHKKLNELESLYTHFSKNHLNDQCSLSTLKKMKRLKIWHLETSDCKFISELKIANLEIAHGKLESLTGLSTMTNLKYLYIYGLKKLIDISEISKNQNIEHLKIEACSKIEDYSSLGGSFSIKHLDVQKINSVDFVSEMSALEYLRFTDCVSGNLLPLIKTKKLKEISFKPNKKHYTHKLKEINDLIIS